MAGEITRLHFLSQCRRNPLFSPRWHFPFTPKRFMVAAGFAFSEI
jgi:hypothetical protein